METFIVELAQRTPFQPVERLTGLRRLRDALKAPSGPHAPSRHPRTARLTYEDLRFDHHDELAAQLRNEQVYRHIGGTVPSAQGFLRGMAAAIFGPPAADGGEVWLNHVVRHSASGAVIGRLEATIHSGVAEVGILLGPEHWGQGYGTEALLWLHERLHARPDRPAPWATTVTANTRSQRLLRRCGYRVVGMEGLPPLQSLQRCDLVYQGPVT
jgi:RimJ/RimL family protein N-acetyltransferase